MLVGYFFSQQGIKSCAVDTSAAIGSTFTITFMVFDYSIPSLNATAARTGIIVNPCETGQYLCSNGTCSSIACNLRQVHLPFDATAGNSLTYSCTNETLCAYQWLLFAEMSLSVASAWYPAAEELLLCCIW